MDPLALALVLFSALMHAGWNLMAKRGRDGLVSMAIIKLPNMVISLAVIAVVGLPGADSWPFVLASGTVNCLYFYFLLNAYRVGDLSLAYPVARGIAPLLLVALSAFIASEVPSVRAFVGIAVTCLGIIAIAQSRSSAHHGATIAWAAGVGLCISIYTLLDGMGGRISANPIGYVAVLNIFTGTAVCGTAFVKRGDVFMQALKTDWVNGALGGAMMLGAYTIAVYAMTLAPMAQVAALRESSVVFAAIMGAIFLKEPFGAKRIAAAVAVTAGIVILAMGR
jgi:drug/metabolite transporter (DMT)-like permease